MMFCSTIRSPAIYSLDNFWIVEDLGSTNGSFLGQRAKKRVKSEAMRFKVNSILTLGEVKIKLKKVVDVKTKTCSKKNMIAKTKPLQKISSNCPPRCNHIFYVKI